MGEGVSLGKGIWGGMDEPLWRWCWVLDLGGAPGRMARLVGIGSSGCCWGSIRWASVVVLGEDPNVVVGELWVVHVVDKLGGGGASSKLTVDTASQAR